MDRIVGKGSLEKPLSETEIRGICEEALAPLALTGKKILVLIPDHTRHARIDTFFHVLHQLLSKRASALDFLIATGTHADVEPGRIYKLVGITEEEHRTTFRNVRFFNHEHKNPSALASLGTVQADEVAALTQGLFAEPIEITINRKVLEYDHILMVTPVVPHEAMGFAGGNKYFFPGIAGIDVIQTFHWVAAVITNPVVNGVKDTPTRRFVDRVSEFIPTPRTCLAFAVDAKERVMCLYAGESKEAWSRAADYSSALHIRNVDHAFDTVLAVTPTIYEDLWVGGKAMYKLEPVIAADGEVIIYGPQIRSLSFVHEKDIQRIGYHVVEYFTARWNAFSREPKLILAHSTNVRGIGTFRDGLEHPRIRVTLATSIPEELCRSVNLGYRDYRTIDLQAWRKRREKNVFVVENAGQDLYRLKN